MTIKKTVIATQQAPRAIGPYSQGISIGELVFVSGQIPVDPTTDSVVVGGIKEQTAQALINLGAVLNASRLSYQDVVKTTVYMKDLSAFAEMNEVYGRIFSAPHPARATIQAAALPKGALIEIEAIAVKRNSADRIAL